MAFGPTINLANGREPHLSTVYRKLVESIVPDCAPETNSALNSVLEGRAWIVHRDRPCGWLLVRAARANDSKKKNDRCDKDDTEHEMMTPQSTM